MNEGTKSVNVRDYYNNGYKEAIEDVLKKIDDLVIETKDVWINANILKQSLNSQTESGLRISDKEVAQPYSKSDKTTKEIGGNSK